MRRLPDSALLRRPLNQKDVAILYRQYSEKELPRTADLGCPTCNKNLGAGLEGTIEFDGEQWQCNCADQLQRYKWYLSSGIGYAYHTLDFQHFSGDQQALSEVSQYMDNSERLIRSGMGMMFLGDFGTGKTMLPMLMLKHFVQQGYRCFATTQNDLVSRTIDSWWDSEARGEYKRLIDTAHILLIDDIGKEHAPEQGSRAASITDSILRERVQHARPTFMTSNLAPKDFERVYRASTLSLIKERSLVVGVKKVDNRDYREIVNSSLVHDAVSGTVRPIV